MSKQKEPGILDLLNKVSADDLAAIDEQIVTKRAEFDEIYKRMDAEILALEQLRKVIDVKLNGKPPRAVRGSKKAAKAAAAATKTDAAPKAESPLLGQIATVLKTSGACKSMTIAKKLGGEHLEHNVRMLLGQNKDRFMRNDDGTWELIQ